MNRVMKSVFVLVLCSLVIAVPSTWAYWIQDGVPLCTATEDQDQLQIVSDGGGGAIVAWRDLRNGSSDIYAQRVSLSGIVQWAPYGMAISTAADEQWEPTITFDGAAGAIIAWADARDGYSDIYAQRVNTLGAVQWTADGVALCTATGRQRHPAITPDGSGGSIVTWDDSRSADSDIYAQRVDASGAVQWIADGVALCTATGNQEYPEIISDGTGGAVITWIDSRGGNSDIYVQRVGISGLVKWAEDGVSLCSATGDQSDPEITSDGAGGAIVTWRDNRSGTNDIYAQRVNSSGVVQWTADGVALCSATGNQEASVIILDDMGGAIIAWSDFRNEYEDIYAQRVNSSGAVQWAADGVALCTASYPQRDPRIISDGAAGAIVAWYDIRSNESIDIYAQHVNASGAVQWAADGVALCTASEQQYSPHLVSDGAAGAIVAWDDLRNGSFDVYAQLVDRNGRVGFFAPRICSVRDVPGDQGGKVYLSWDAARPDVFMDDEMSHYTIWRAISPFLATKALDAGAAALESLSDLEMSSDKPVIRIERVGGLTYYWELIETVDALYMEAYGKPVATLFDSTAVCDEYHYFQVVAHTTDPKVFWKSEPDSGYSVDNLCPCSPACLAGEQSFTPEGLNLTWNRNTESDLDDYRVYRGLTEDFVPGSGNLVASTCDTMCFDGGWSWSGGYFYKVSAVDVHGNECGYAFLGPENITGADTPKTPEASYLSQNYPNPFNPTTKVVFGLSVPGRVSLRIYDVVGRLVRVLAEGACASGHYTEIWDGRDEWGRSVSSGVYFYRLDAGAFTQTKKMVLLR